MKLRELAALAADEQKAEAFLQSRGLLQRFTHCPYCKWRCSKWNKLSNRQEKI